MKKKLIKEVGAIYESTSAVARARFGGKIFATMFGGHESGSTANASQCISQ
jgi:hypothetical protein